jgi:hypothetical protein
LSGVAESLLATAGQYSTTAAGKTNVATPDTAMLGVQDSQQLRPSDNAALTAAELRLNLLRHAVEPILNNHGVPADLAAVILVESAGRPTALSPKGARGLWQLMPDTARRYGLRVDEIQDQRLDLFKATDAAARYLHDLYAQFDDWKLALAAYNTGEANVVSAISRAHTQDFDQLAILRMLPVETRNYVPRVLATAQSIRQSSSMRESRNVASAAVVFAAAYRPSRKNAQSSILKDEALCSAWALAGDHAAGDLDKMIAAQSSPQSERLPEIASCLQHRRTVLIRR